MIYNSLYKTHPSTIHTPGAIHDLFNMVKSKIFDTKYKLKDCSEVTIVTWNNTRFPGPLQQCLTHFGLNFRVFGKGIKNWRNPLKIELLLEQIGTIKTKYILGADDFDVLLFHNPSHILRNFKKTKCKLLYNSEAKNHPKDGFGDFEKEIGGDYLHPYLNAGVFIGETVFCQKFYTETYEKNKSNDGIWRKSEQAYVKDAFPRFHPDVKIDYRCELFQAAHSEDPMLDQIILQ